MGWMIIVNCVFLLFLLKMNDGGEEGVFIVLVIVMGVFMFVILVYLSVFVMNGFGLECVMLLFG